MTQPVWEQPSIRIPEKLVYDDYRGAKGGVKVDLRGWLVSRGLFTRLAKNGSRQTLEQLRLDDTIGLSVELLSNIRGFQRLRVLSLRASIIVSFEVATLLGSFSKLMELDISDCQVDFKSFTVISQTCQMLQSLIVQNCPGLDDYCMQALAQCMQRFRRLKRLDFSRASGDFSDEGVLSVLQAAPKLLTSLALSNIKCLGSLSITGLRTRMPSLTSLDLSSYANLTQTAFEWVAEGCRSLTSLDLTKSAEFDDGALIKLGGSCRFLKKLLLSSCTRLTDIGVAGFFSVHEGRLKVLDLSACIQCKGVSALSIAKKAEDLEQLKLNGLSQISAVGLLALWSATKKLQTFEMAVELRTTVTHRKSMIPHISDEVLISAEYDSLREVHLSGACLVTDIGACALATKCPNLFYLDISYCGEITDVFLGKLAETLPLTFHSLKANGCGKIRNAGVEALSKGCINLKLLEVSGCSKVTDAGMLAIARFKRLEVLAVSNCDSINTEAMCTIAQSCRFLRSVEFSGMDLVGIEAVSAFCRHCPNLSHLTCDNCNFRQNEFIDATRLHVALSKPMTTRMALEPRPRPVLEHNRYTLRIKEMDVRVRVLQRFCKAIAVRTRSHRHHNLNKQAVIDIRRLFQAYQHEKGKRKDKLWRILKRRAALIIQKWFMRMSGIFQNWKKVRRMKHRNIAVWLIQRVYRGHMARKRVRAAFQRLYRFYNKIGHLVWKYRVILDARKTHRHILKAQSIGRMFPYKLNYWLYRRSIKTIQVRFLNYFRRRQASHRAINSIVSKLECKAVSAAKIQKNWRIRQFNKQMAPYVFFCCIVWRTRDDERDWRIVMVQSWYRGSIQRIKQWRLDQIPIVRNRAAKSIQKVFRGWASRRVSSVRNARLKSQMAFWRRITRRCCALRMGRYTKPFQRGYKLHYFQILRFRAAINIQRAYRGLVGRNIYREKRDIWLGVYTAKAQRQWRRYKGRRMRKQEMAIQHMAAWRIQRKIHGFFDSDGKRRIQAATAARLRRDLVNYKRQLLVNKWTQSLANRRNYFIYLYARRVQTCFRDWSKRKYMRELAKENAAAAMAQAEEEELIKRKNRFLSAIPNPFRPAIRLATAAAKQILAAPLISVQDEPRLFNAVLKFHTRSIQQVGIVNLKFTFGETEYKICENQQSFLKGALKPCYEMVPGDLSGNMRLHLHLWFMRGTGAECLTQIKVALKPENTSQPQLRSREAALAMKCEKITWHPTCHVEIQSKQTIKQGLGGFAVANLKIVYTEEEGDTLREQGGWILCSDLNPFGLPSFLWAQVREPIDDTNMYKTSKIKTKDWCDKRLLKAMFTFNLSESDVLSLRKIFDSALGSSESEMLRVSEMMTFMSIEADELTKWIVSAVKPRRANEVSFSEYLHIVCYFCMFGRRDLRRFVFGCVDVDQLCYLKRDKFMTLVEVLADPAVGNVLKWQLQYDKYKDKKLDSLFFKGFEQFTEVYRGVMWKTEEMQKKFKIANLGEPFWEDKANQFTSTRKTLGVRLL